MARSDAPAAHNPLFPRADYPGPGLRGPCHGNIETDPGTRRSDISDRAITEREVTTKTAMRYPGHNETEKQNQG